MRTDRRDDAVRGRTFRHRRERRRRQGPRVTAGEGARPVGERPLDDLADGLLHHTGLRHTRTDDTALLLLRSR
ncbi:hypothetical protein ACIQD1_27825 [Streptomyces sp. NPDC093088]|uniref:hypothetical protein n=1 Tax=Streptomyces sp. NPDC093088 TaxID=3366023 RepID=UPI0037FC2989